MSDIPVKIIFLIKKTKNEQLRELDLSARLTGFYLKEIPVEVFEIEHLEQLSLRNNQINKIPTEISKLKNLKYLDLIESAIRCY